MNEKKISTNIFYNVLNQVVSLITPLVLAPYVARVLSAELIGDYSYALANSSYFVLIEALGLSLYGMLCVSSNRENKELISKLFKEIMFAKIILMMVCMGAYALVFIIFNDKNKILCIIMLLNIFSTGIDATWFLMGLEDFKTTTIRNIGVRLVNIILVLNFVKSQNDLLIYALIMQSSNALSYIIVLPTVKKYIIPVKPSYNKIIVHIRKSILYFIPGIINTIFTSADKTVLGAFANSYEVGVYEQATKITNLCGSVINSVSNVLLPRVTYLNHKKNGDESKKFLLKSLGYASLVSIAVASGIVCVAEVFVPVFFGPGYDKSAVLLKILAVNVLMSVLANYIGQQCLVSNYKQREYNIAIGCSAVINLLMNILLVNNFQSVGVSIASSFSAIITFIMVMYYSRKNINFKDIVQITCKAVVASICMILMSSIIELNSLVSTLVAKVVVGAITYIVILALLQEQVMTETIKNYKSYMMKK